VGTGVVVSEAASGQAPKAISWKQLMKKCLVSAWTVLTGSSEFSVLDDRKSFCIARSPTAAKVLAKNGHLGQTL
jgi:hypothetical protein